MQPPEDLALVTQLSEAQEIALANQPKILVVTYLIVNDWKFQEIVSAFQMDDSELIDILLRLDRLKIIEYRPPYRVGKRTSRNFAWRTDGPVAISFEGLASEFESLARHDARLPLERRNGCSAILAVRSWEFSEFTRLRRRSVSRDSRGRLTAVDRFSFKAECRPSGPTQCVSRHEVHSAIRVWRCEEFR
jgi:hypothetical protein